MKIYENRHPERILKKKIPPEYTHGVSPLSKPALQLTDIFLLCRRNILRDAWHASAVLSQAHRSCIARSFMNGVHQREDLSKQRNNSVKQTRSEKRAPRECIYGKS